MKYKEFKEQIKEEQSSMSKEEIVDYMKKKSEYVLDLDNLTPVKHVWIDRGAKMSCENAGHPMHQAWKRTRQRV